MAYNEFAYFYDELNGEADYEALYTYVRARLEDHGLETGIVADLGCGTGDLTLMLTQAGYDMIGVDQSEEMLAVLREKAEELGVAGRVLLLQQDILALDLYGTIHAAVSTFDTFNHIGPQEHFERAVYRAAFFMEKGGVFVFDLNTPYKHRQRVGRPGGYLPSDFLSGHRGELSGRIHRVHLRTGLCAGGAGALRLFGGVGLRRGNLWPPVPGKPAHVFYCG